MAVIKADAWQPLVRPPTPTARSKAAFGACSRIACGMELSTVMQSPSDKVAKEFPACQILTPQLYKTIQMFWICPLLRRRSLLSS